MRLPRLKSAHSPVRVDDQTIRIGRAFGVAAELTDTDGLLWSLMNWMDGSQTVAKLAARAHEQFPWYSADVLEDVVEQLVETGFFDDADAAIPVSAESQERYSRSMAYYSHIDRTPRRSIWEIQATITASRVVVVGVGGLGSACAHALAASGVGGLTLVDPDVVESSNLSLAGPVCRRRSGASEGRRGGRATISAASRPANRRTADRGHLASSARQPVR